MTSTTLATAPSVTAPPFFLVGSERSGTTLLRLMLSHHPRISCAPEFEFLVDQMDEEGAFPDAASYRSTLEVNRVFRPHGLEVDPELEARELVRSFVDQFAEREGKPIHGATCHHVFHRLPLVWPEARYIHLLRDGRDVSRSCIGMGWAGNVWHGAERWIEAREHWERLKERVPTERLLEVRYEDLIRHTESELDRICRFLGDSYEEAIFDYVDGSTYERPDEKLVAQWRRKLSERELGLLEARIGPMLRAAGYEESGVPADPMSAATRLSLYLQNRWFGFRFRMQRYGLGNVVLDFVARKLGLRSLHRRLQVARNDADDRHLK